MCSNCLQGHKGFGFSASTDCYRKDPNWLPLQIVSGYSAVECSHPLNVWVVKVLTEAVFYVPQRCILRLAIHSILFLIRQEHESCAHRACPERSYEGALFEGLWNGSSFGNKALLYASKVAI
jgi:hypothetical protein